MRLATSIHRSPPAGGDPHRDRPAWNERRAAAGDEPEDQIGFRWLLRLRWGAVAGQLVALLYAWRALDLRLPYGALLGLIAFTALTNMLLALLPNGAGSRWRLPAVLATDVIVLTVMLACSGGAENPFTVFFLVHVALAALLLEAPLAWALVALTALGFGALFALPQHAFMGHHHPLPWPEHLAGMWVAYALAACFVAHFVGKVSRAIRERDRSLAKVAHLAVQNERLASLSSFSANAAHELGSPLATIGLAAKELAGGLARGTPVATLAADADLVSREVARCREILADLASRAGESVGEMPLRTTPGHLVEELRRALSPRLVPHLRVSFEGRAAERCAVVVPVRTATQMLHNLVRNAFEAQDEAGVEEPVEVRVVVGARLCFHVLDRGPGVPEPVRERLGEPFVTTKGDRGGLGLGIYLARAYVERTGGHLLVERRPGGGTDVELCLVRDAIVEGPAGTR